jgi:hypothetical protein
LPIIDQLLVADLIIGFFVQSFNFSASLIENGCRLEKVSGASRSRAAEDPTIKKT